MNWLRDVIDLLAHEYGWTVDQILSLHFRHVWHLIDRILERQEFGHRQRIGEMASASIVPHLTNDDRRDFFRKLETNADQSDDENVSIDDLRRQSEHAKALVKELTYR